MNEEKVKNDIIVPFFKKLGFDGADIEYETSFSIKLGRSTHVINGEKDRASGRLDILFKNGNQNLFVVETKPQNQELSEEDKEQAISYARLLKQIAPFAVLTNGVETKIYDVISMEELSQEEINKSEYVTNGCSISLDSELKYQALKKFIGLNFNNFKFFCQKQLDTNLRNFIADNDNPERKFIPETYLRREGLIEAFKKFMEYKTKNGKMPDVEKKKGIVFAITGESGFGKTNAMIDLATEFINSNPVLFFNGSRICQGILEEIAYDFNWKFEGEQTGLTIIKKLGDIFSQHCADLVIFIDAVDEAPAKNFEIDLDNFVKNLPGDNIKICLSCKKSLWNRYLKISSEHSYIRNCLFLDAIKENRTSSFTIRAFSNIEVGKAIKKYGEVFNLPKIEGITRELCKNPLMLRIISEIYAHKEIIPTDMINQTVLKKYIERKMEKSPNPRNDLKFLSIFGRALFEANKESLYEDEINEGLDVPEYLISFSILTRIPDVIGRYLICFQYDYIRDFIICYHSVKLDGLTPNQVSELIQKKVHENVARNVFSYFERVAQNEVKEVVRKEFSKYNCTRALEFMRHYQQILDTEFSVIKNRFNPYTMGEIGLLVFYHLNPYLAPTFGFRRVSGDEKKLIWLEKENWFDEADKELDKIALKNGVKIQITARPNFKEIDPKEYAKKLITTQLKKIIENRILNESNNYVLMEEYILNMMSNFNQWLDLPEFDKEFWKKALPISVDDLIERAASVIKSTTSGLGKSVPPPEDFVKLLNYLHRIKSKKARIETTLLPFPSNSKIPRLGAWLVNEYSLDELKEYLNTYFQLVLQEYKILVDYNLSDLRDKMKTYKTLPTRVIGEIEQINGKLGLNYCLIPGRDEIKVK